MQQDGKSISNYCKKRKTKKTKAIKPALARSTSQPLEQMTKLRDSSHNLKRNILNKHLTKLKQKDTTINPTKSRAYNKN